MKDTPSTICLIKATHAFSVKTNSSSITLSKSSPPPMLSWNWFSNYAIKIICTSSNLLFCHETHFVATIIIRFVQIQQFWVLQNVHDFDLKIEIQWVVLRHLKWSSIVPLARRFFDLLASCRKRISLQKIDPSRNVCSAILGRTSPCGKSKHT